MGGGGQGTQDTTNSASYPEEFRPIARSAADQIMAMQNALPLANFSQPNPGQTAGLAPFQQAVANFAPQLLAPSWGLDTLQNLGNPISQLAGNAVSVGNQTDPFTRAMNATASGGFGGGAQSFPGAAFQNPTPMTTPTMSQPAPQPTIAGPGTQDLIAQLMGSLSSPIPSTTPVLPGAVTGPVPGNVKVPPPITPQLDKLIQTLIQQTAPQPTAYRATTPYYTTPGSTYPSGR